MVNTCDFCNTSKIDVFHTNLVIKLKEKNIFSSDYPVLCSECYKTYSSVKNLEKFLEENGNVNCTVCGKEFSHYDVLFDGCGHTAYCECNVCGIQYTVTVTSDFFAKVSEINQLVTPNLTL